MRNTIQSLESKTDVDPLTILIDELIAQLQSGRSLPYAGAAIAHLRSLDLAHLQALISHGKKITVMDKRYILCFAAGMTVEDIADFMSLEPASVYTVRYRLKKKFPTEYPFPY
jgi:DNA-binding CsgD family transcriptional regulator